MGTLTIRKLDERVKERLRIRAARAGRSMEEEARIILANAVVGLDGPALLTRTRELFGEAHGAELDLPKRDAPRPGPDFDEG